MISTAAEIACKSSQYARVHSLIIRGDAIIHASTITRVSCVLYLAKGGLHQNAFSPQLSLVTGGAPTLTINSFSSPNSANGVASTTGVLLQEYQPPIGATAATGCNVTVNSGSSCLTTNTSSTSSGMLVHGGGAVQATTGAVAGSAMATKRREAFLPSQGQPVKLENKSNRTSCLCRNSNGTNILSANLVSLTIAFIRMDDES